MISEPEVYQRLGEAGFARVVGAFYRRVREDAAAGGALGRMYPPDDWAGAEERLRDFLVYRFGGPQRYIEQRGHPRLRMRHMPFAIDAAARDRWLGLMSEALEEAAVDAEAREVLWGFFVQVAEMMRNR
jgi:hemoglobin